jgi:anti-sigma factor RsiW
MTRPDDVAPVPDLYLERYLLGELPHEERERIERLLELDPELRDRLDTLKGSEAETARLHPAPLMADQIRNRLRRAGMARSTGDSARRAWGWRVPALVAAVVVLAVGLSVVRPPSPTDDIRVKGADAELVVFRKTSSGSERLEPGASALPGDLIRLGYRAAGRTFGVIVSTDGRGSVTQHLPRTGGRAASLEAGATVLLDFSYELDDAPRWERFYIITGDEPFELEPVRRAARRVATTGSEHSPPALELARGLEQSVFSLTKETVQ